MCWASPRPIRRGWARARFRPNRTMRSAKIIGQRGREFGTVTGRKRRCGWFDAVLVRQAIKTSGIHGIALTKLDVLDGLDGDQGRRRLLCSTASASTGFRRRKKRRNASSPSMKASKAGRTRRRARGLGRNSPPRRSNMCRYLEELIECPVALLSTIARARRHHPDEGSVRGLRLLRNCGFRRNSRK